MKLRNRKLVVEKDDVTTPSQQYSTDKNPQALDKGMMIISICEDNGDVEVISSKDMDNSSHQRKNETTEDDLILMKEICSSQAESNPRKRKRSDDEDVKVSICSPKFYIGCYLI
jgi:hypothetical protein